MAEETDLKKLKRLAGEKGVELAWNNSDNTRNSRGVTLYIYGAPFSKLFPEWTPDLPQKALKCDGVVFQNNGQLDEVKMIARAKERAAGKMLAILKIVFKAIELKTTLSEKSKAKKELSEEEKELSEKETEKLKNILDYKEDVFVDLPETTALSTESVISPYYIDKLNRLATYYGLTLDWSNSTHDSQGEPHSVVLKVFGNELKPPLKVEGNGGSDLSKAGAQHAAAKKAIIAINHAFKVVDTLPEAGYEKFIDLYTHEDGRVKFFTPFTAARRAKLEELLPYNDIRDAHTIDAIKSSLEKRIGVEGTIDNTKSSALKTSTITFTHASSHYPIVARGKSSINTIAAMENAVYTLLNSDENLRNFLNAKEKTVPSQGGRLQR